ncbi:uncharacterized protein LOC119733015 [Patiria miniata]|uniref:Ig-like domain-containing protein n=1 Tax=Patiria miniata TaxID=46514 RepID=A0A914AGK9_PATMI|nr:uncharacterized protein LOC119733015 [Patiria miniata]
MGTLNVSRVPIGGSVTGAEVLFSRSGEQTNRTTWLEAEICVTNLSSNFFIAFEAIRVNGRLSDIAIDDVGSQVTTYIALFEWFGYDLSIGDIVYVSEGEHHRFTCMVPDLRTPVSLSWMLGGLEISPDKNNNLTESDGFTTSTSTVAITISESNHGELLQCMAFVAGIHPVVNIFITLDVKVKPKASNMLLYVANWTGSDASPGMDEGMLQYFKCEVVDIRPAASFEWFLDGASQRISSPSLSEEDDWLVDVSDTWSFTPTRANHGQEVKCVVNNTESEEPFPSKVLTVLVNGPPDILAITGSPTMTANKPSVLVCRAYTGYPDNWNLAWSNGDTPLTGTTTVSASCGSGFMFTSTLAFTPRREDNGNNITCSAQKTSWTRPTEMACFGPIDVQCKYKPTRLPYNASYFGNRDKGSL